MVMTRKQAKPTRRVTRAEPSSLDIQPQPPSSPNSLDSAAITGSCVNTSVNQNSVQQAPDSYNMINLQPNQTLVYRVANFKFAEFKPLTEEWRYYIERFGLEIRLQGLHNEAESKRDLLLKCIGPELYRLVSDRFSPRAAYAVSYDEIVNFFNAYYKPTAHFLVERVKFGECRRKQNTTVTQFIGELRSLATLCEFGNNLDERLRDQFVVGLQDADIQQKIFAKHPNVDSTLNEVLQTALLEESAQKQRTSLNTPQPTQPTTQTPEVCKVQAHKNNTRPKPKTNASNSKPVVTSDKNCSDNHIVLDASKQCMRCGREKHQKDEKCPAANSTCRQCNKAGHWQQFCINSGNVALLNYHKRKTKRNAAHAVSVASRVDTIYRIDDGDGGMKIMIDVLMNQKPISMQYDCAAHQSTIGRKLWRDLGKPSLSPTPPLDGYTHIPLKILGQIDVNVQLNDKLACVQAIVMEDDDVTPLFGINWMYIFNVLPNRNDIRLVNVPDSTVNLIDERTATDVSNIMNKFPLLFADGIGHVTNFKASIPVKDTAVPVIARPRPVPFALINQVDKELDRQIAEGTLERLDDVKEPVEWASPVIISSRKNGDIRVIGDFKSTLNPHIAFESYPLPTFEEATSKLSGYTEFSIIDLKDAFLQLEVDEPSRKYLTLSTHRGYFRHRRLPWGLTVSPMIFQRFMDTILRDCEGVAWYQDDIALGGKDREDHLIRLNKVLSRLESIGLKTQKSKVKLLQNEITFLGHRISKDGIQPEAGKIDDLRNADFPTNTTELRSFLGSVNQYTRFIPNLQQKVQPLHRLLQKNVRWNWTKDDEKLYDELKGLITADSIIAHYQPELPVILSVDASEKGLGAVLQHKFVDGTERLIAAASRTLAPAEKNYSSIDREALAIIFGVGKFERYLRGRKFTLRTDHKPLERLFGEKAAIPKMAAQRLIRWAIALSAFDYSIEYIPGKQNHTADTLSRLPSRNGKPSNFELANGGEINLVQERICEVLLTKRIVRNKTLGDSILSKVIGYVRRGWPEKRNLKSDQFNTYFEKRNELSVEQDLLMWHDRIVIPASLKSEILSKLHETHAGASAMKSIARSAVWWPNCDQDIEHFVKNCATCCKSAPNQPEVPLFLWNTPDRPWERVHIDFTGPYDGSQWFVVIDAHSRWLEIFPVAHATSEIVIKIFRSLIARYGVCRQIVSDNGTQFTSDMFRKFCKDNQIQLILTTPYHSRSNGRVERAIRTFKWRYGKASDQFADKDHRLQAMLFSYRSTIHTSTGRTPAELFLKRNLTTNLELLKPDVGAFENTQAFRQKCLHDGNKKERNLSEGEEVWHRNKTTNQWEPATVQKKTGPLSYRIATESKNMRVHADHIRPKRTTKLPAKLQDFVRG